MFVEDSPGVPTGYFGSSSWRSHLLKDSKGKLLLGDFSFMLFEISGSSSLSMSLDELDEDPCRICAACRFAYSFQCWLGSEDSFVLGLLLGNVLQFYHLGLLLGGTPTNVFSGLDSFFQFSCEGFSYLPHFRMHLEF